MPNSLVASRVAIVSGKGGVGKTTVAAAIGLAAARTGRRVLLIEVEQRQGLAPLFGHHHTGYDERPLGENIIGLSVAPDEALVEYLYLFYGIRYVGRVLKGSKAIEFATNVAPGLRDILLIGKVKEAERRRVDGRYAFDLLVVDAPPTGRLPRFLEAPRAVAELVHGGPIKTQAQGVLDMVFDPKRCRVVLVTLPEDMPVRETAEAAEVLTKMGVALGPVVVNGLYPDALPTRSLRAVAKDARPELEAEAERAGVRLGDEALGELARVAGAHARRTLNQQRAMRELENDTNLPMVKLPYLFGARIGVEEVGALADSLAAQGTIG